MQSWQSVMFKLFEKHELTITTDRAEKFKKMYRILTPVHKRKLRIEISGSQRYHLSQSRLGYAAPLGGGGRNKGETPYSIYAVWN